MALIRSTDRGAELLNFREMTFPPDDPGRDDIDAPEPIPETPAEDPFAPDERLADETPDDAKTTPLADARTVEAQDEAAEAEAILSVGTTTDAGEEQEEEAAEPESILESTPPAAEEFVEVTAEPSLEDAELVDVTEE